MFKYTIEFFQQFAANKQGFCLSKEYHNCRTKLLWQCKRGHQWEAQPRKILEGSWCPKCYMDNCRKYKCNDAFFSQDTEESFYVAGFLAADGWKTRKSGGAYTIGLELAKKDFEHLVKIRELMGSDAKLSYRERERKGTATFSYTFIVRSKQMYEDLERFGVIESKTYIYDMPEWLKSHQLVHHFLRGYIDGDGCFAYAQNKGQKKHVNFSMRGTAEMLTSFNNIMIANKIITNEHNISPKVGMKYAAFDKLQYSGNGVCLKMYDYLYNNATIYLKRKRDIVEKSKHWAVYGTGKRRAIKSTAVNITADDLLEKARELKSQKKIAEYFGCSSANISWLTKDYGIRSQMQKAMGKFDESEIVKLYGTLKTKAAVARHVGLTKSRVGQIIKKHESFVNEENLRELLG